MSTVNVYDKEGKEVVGTVNKPELFDMELRADLVRKVVDCVRQNRRQPYAVSPNAGKQHSAESWGTGRAMARVPRVKASGTRRAGQAAFANFARKGRMAHPTKTHRRWHRKTNLHLRRTVALMGIAASGNAGLVEGRGHRISGVKSLPLVVADSVNQIEKTKEAMQTLVNLNLEAEIDRVKDSKTTTSGKGKFRSNRYNQRTGILMVSAERSMPAFANIPGVEIACVEDLNLLRLCPGGELGRMIVWTESAFRRLETLYEEKKDYTAPNKMVTEENLEEYFYSPEVQKLLKTPALLPRPSCKKTDEELKRTEELLALW